MKLVLQGQIKLYPFSNDVYEVSRVIPDDMCTWKYDSTFVSYCELVLN
jgi:hypothetical protein